MKRYFFLSVFLLIILSGELCEAQSHAWLRFPRREFMFGAGATNFLGDLGGANQIGTNGLRDFDWPAVRPAFSIGYRYRTGREHAVKGNLVYARLGGNDKFTEEPYRQNRNCNFRSPVWEINCQYEYTVVRQREGHRYNFKGVQGWRNIDIQTYLFAGIGFMYFNPKGNKDNKWYPLKPLRTEGQGYAPTRRKYSLFQVVLPFGIGFKYAISKDWCVGIEYGIRKTFTDYVDDVSKTYFDSTYLRRKKGPLSSHFSNPTIKNLGPEVTAFGQQRGDPRDKDSYMFAIMSFYYKIPRGKFTLPKFK